MASSAGKRVLLTGGTGFVASHVLDLLVKEGFQVLVTVRSQEKGRNLLESFDADTRKSISFGVVEDIAKDGAFDEILKSNPVDIAIHTASPFHHNVQDPVKDFLDPAIKGTTGILESIKKCAPAVKRVVITSSSAAILVPENHLKVYNESSWSPMTWEKAMDSKYTYRASKIFAEKAAWEFMDREKPSFTLATMNPTFVFGPIQRQLPSSLDAINTSNHPIRDMLLGRMKDGIPPTRPTYTFVDVRDVALSHVRAATVEEAAGRRFYTVGGHFSNARVAEILRRKYSWMEDRLPSKPADDLPPDVFQFDVSRSKKLLGVEYKSLEESVINTAESLLAKFGDAILKPEA